MNDPKQYHMEYDDDGDDNVLSMAKKERQATDKRWMSVVLIANCKAYFSSLQLILQSQKLHKILFKYIRLIGCGLNAWLDD